MRWIKLGVSVALVAILAYAVDWSSMPARLARIEPWAAALAFVAYAAQLFISAWKWQWSMIIHGLRERFGFVSRVYLIGFFLNNFLPSSIGGDAYRVYRTMPNEGYRSRALSAVLLERVVGLAVLLTLGAVGALLLFQYTFAKTYLVILAAGSAGAVVLWLSLKLPQLQRLSAKIFSHPRLAPITHNVGLLKTGGSAYVPLIAISLLFQLQAIAINYLLFVGTGNDVSLAKCAVITAAVGLATIVPLSINGIGVLEGAFAGSAIALGVDYEHAILVAILIRLLVLPLSLLSGLVYAWDARASPASTAKPVAD